MSGRLKILIPIGVIVVSIVGALLMVVSKPELTPAPQEVARKAVRALEVRQQAVQMVVRSQGTVIPRTESALVAQVSGLILSVSPAFVVGGFFEAGETLVSLDPRDNEFAVTLAKNDLAQAELNLAVEEEESAIAREEWQRLNKGDATALAAREPQLNRARAALEAARARLNQAQLNLERTRIRAPFPGRVRIKNVDVGQYVTPGMALATVYAVDYVEVRLPIPDNELAFIDVPVDLRNTELNPKAAKVILQARFAGQDHAWQGHLTRIEGEIDQRSRMIHAVARVENPFGQAGNQAGQPLTVGLFVHADIVGKTMNGLFPIPRAALRDNNQVLIIDDEELLRFRSVEPLRVDGEIVFVKSGLKDGERICISPLQAVVEGMPVRVTEGLPISKSETEVEALP